MTIVEIYNGPLDVDESARVNVGAVQGLISRTLDPLACIQGNKMAWGRDTTNFSNEVLVTVPRHGVCYCWFGGVHYGLSEDLEQGVSGLPQE